MNEFSDAFHNFEANIEEEPLNLDGHSGCSGTIATTAREFYDHDEIAAEEAFSNFLDSEDLDQLVSLEDALNGDDLTSVLEDQAVESFINGQFRQFVSQFENLDTDDFLTHIEGNEKELEMLRHIITSNL